MSTSASFHAQREALSVYFDRTARAAWIDLTSDVKVSGVRATVRAGRDRMRAMLLDWLPEDLRRRRVLDAGCGTGALACVAARRGADVTAVDVAGGLVEIARERQPGFLGHGRIDWHVGDMTDARFGQFDHVVAMDSLIHYRLDDTIATLVALAPRCTGSMVFTVAPATPLLRTMHAAGQLFPRKDRSPAIQPVGERALARELARALPEWKVARCEQVTSGFYISRGVELVRA